MKWYKISLFILSISLGCKMFDSSSSSFSLKFSEIDTNQVHPKNRRLQKLITLPNKLDVLLISDPDINKSAAAMDVLVGSLADPISHQGIAHFLEHVLFLGTTKYPDVDEYSRYLKNYQGMSNAYTDSENTNYFFEVNHDGFEGALDRFAQFFISPKFSEDFVARERDAVNSEHEKNIKSDSWRTQQLLRSLHKDGHPEQKFATGDKNTLAQTTRDQLIEFYGKYYSANLMKLAVMSDKSLDELETIIRKTFADVPNKNLSPIKYDSEVFAASDLPRIVTFIPIKDSNKLRLVFKTQSQDAYWKSKPYQLLGHILGYEGKGSLLSHLKEEHLATELAAGLNSSSYAGLFTVEINLTKKGFENYSRILEMFFAYIHMMKEKGLPSYLYDERKIMADINYVYREPMEGGHVASHYANAMHDHPGDLIDKREFLFHKYSPEDYKIFLDAIDEKQMTVFLSSQAIKKESLDRTETYYQNHFHSAKVEPKLLQQLSNPETIAGFDLPAENPFIPHKLELASSEKKTVPQKLFDNENGKLWFQQDDQFHLPKAFGRIDLITPKTSENPKQVALSLLYFSALHESHNEWFYDLSLAGLSLNALRSDRGVSVDFSGYAENIPMLLAEGTKKLKEITISEDTFAALKDEIKRNIANASFDNAYNQAMYELRYLVNPSAFHRYDIYDPDHKVDLISSVTLNEVKAYAKVLYAEVGIEAFVFGSMNAEAVKNSVAKIHSILNAKPLPRNQYITTSQIKLKKGERLARVLNNKTNNNSFAMSVHFGERNFQTNAAIRLGLSVLQNEFYTELRTKQQLGYVVHMAPDFYDKLLGVLFLVQSSEFDNNKVAKSVYKFFDHGLATLKQVSDEDFENIKRSVISELRDKEKNMSDKAALLFAEAYSYKETFNYKYQVSLAVEKLTKQDVISVFEHQFSDKERSSISVYLNKDKVGAKPYDKLNETLIKDAAGFKKAAAVF